MWTDPIVEEVRRARRAYAAQFNHDLHAICEDLRRREKEDCCDDGRYITPAELRREREEDQAA